MPFGLEDSPWKPVVVRAPPDDFRTQMVLANLISTPDLGACLAWSVGLLSCGQRQPGSLRGTTGFPRGSCPSPSPSRLLRVNMLTCVHRVVSAPTFSSLAWPSTVTLPRWTGWRYRLKAQVDVMVPPGGMGGW